MQEIEFVAELRKVGKTKGVKRTYSIFCNSVSKMDALVKFPLP